MYHNIRFPLLLLVATIILSSCSSSPKKKQPLACSCQGYFTNKAKPAWVDVEGQDSRYHFSYGLTQCTSLKEIDLKETAIQARSNLVRMMESDVSSQITLIRRSDSASGIGSQGGESKTQINAQALLKNSEMYDHWVDPKSCIVYSAVRIAKADIQKQIEQQKRKIKNQPIVINAAGEHSQQIQLALVQTLTKLGAKIIDPTGATADSSALQVSAKVNSIDVFESQKLVRLSLLLSAKDPVNNKIIWSQSLSGKSLSLTVFNQDYQVRQALQDALDKSEDKLLTWLEQQR